MKRILILLFCLFPLAHRGQEAEPVKFNFGFEQTFSQNGWPAGWTKNNAEVYAVGTDTVVRHGGEKSLRITGPDHPDGRSFSYVFTRFPAEYSGAMLKVRVWLKLDSVSEGMVNVLARIDGKNSTLGSGGLREKVSGTSGWKEYEIPVYYPPAGARTITVGIVHSGNGTVWADDMGIELDGERIENITPVPLVIPKGESDREFDKGSGLDAALPGRIPIEELKKLGFIWGFLKYHHPALARGDWNWDYELFRFLKKLAALPAGASSGPLYLDWIRSLGDYSVETGPMPEFSPAPERMDRLSISGELRQKLEKLINARRNGKNYYAEFYYGQYPLFTNEESYGGFEVPDAGFRFLALLRYWNIIEYFFPYKNIIGEDWLGVLEEFIPRFIGAPGRLEYFKSALALGARIRDGHGVVYESGRFHSGYGGSRFHNAEVKFIGTRAFVTNTWPVNGSTSPLRPGDEITALDGRKIEDIWNEYLPYIPASNTAAAGRGLAQQILWTDSQRIKAETVTKEGRKQEVSLTTFPGNMFGPPEKKRAGFKWIDPDIAYIFPAAISGEDSLRKIGERLQSCKALIIDMRCYPRGGFLPVISEYLYPDSTAFMKFTFGSAFRPGSFDLQPPVKTGGKNPGYFKGKIIVLTDETTQSMAEGCVMAFRAAPDCTIIGSVTAGADGSVPSFSLPGGITACFTAVGVFYPDGTPTQRIGIVPDIYCAPTVKGVRQGKDEILEKGIETARKAVKAES